MADTSSLEADENACIKKLAELYANGVKNGSQLSNAELGIKDDSRIVVLGRMAHLGAITGVHHSTAGQYAYFQISPKAIELARTIKAAEEKAATPEPRNIVADIEQKVKSNPLTAWLIIGFFALAALISVITNLISLLEKFGVIRSVQR